MKSIKDLNLEGKKVFLRADYNVPIEDGRIAEGARISASLPTIEYILGQNPKALVIVSHLGKPEGKPVEEFSLTPVRAYLNDALVRDIEFIRDIDNLETRINDSDGGVFLLENVRFWPGEENGDENFAKRLASGFDVFVGDAFSVAHRAHASVALVPKFVRERCAGLLLLEEYSELSKVKDNPVHPAVAIIGGAKIETKLPVINNLSRIYDRILVGGKIANEALDQGISLGDKVVLPEDFSPEDKKEMRLDIGVMTVERFMQGILAAKTIVWNGPLGKFEDEDACMGTKMIVDAIAKNTDAYRVIGGGETIEAVKRFGNENDFEYISMSGGAMLEFMEGKALPGIEALV